jgi:hypothetical protein
MSIQNILEPNNLNLFCDNLNVSGQIINSWGNIPGLYIVTHNVPLYYNNVQISTLSCTFIRLSSGNIPGICMMIIPNSPLSSQSVSSQYYLDISSFEDVLISTTVTIPYIIENNGNYTTGAMQCNSSTNHIIISGGVDLDTYFEAGGNPCGLPYQGYIIYKQAFA